MAKKDIPTKEKHVATSLYRNARISPSKVRLTANEIRGTKVTEAQNKLAFYNTKAATMMNKILMSAIANAKQKGLEKENLYIENVTLGPARTLKSGRIVSKGQMHPILKRSSHIAIKLSLLNDNDMKETSKKKVTKGEKDE